MAAVTVGDISQEAIDDFERQKDYISSRSNIKGLNWRVIIIILLLRRSMKSFRSRQEFTGHSVNMITRILLPSPFGATVFT